ncbi:AAA family ATPase [Planktothrix sp. FACHB-1355]|uniref:AAA family ATPase n=1 Tax=Aerosakkonema funiforme FACHB-1375 TaxID=2949571 RepID=A0A926ZGW4_9CYAN|nr:MULTISPECIES: AAA family ATPase [Oscillatoriales]MBD2182405.1 AAA family ATPase [Aerosakkonema funiforme FACHB-1375]MBD3558279.1 AAA family ATPase [Planktothrix sp. FACHB-1355]
MRVTHLKINSFRGISDMTLEFAKDEPTVFIGDNGVGKSSLLDCLAILLSWFINRIKFDPKSRTSIYSRVMYESIREGEVANGGFFNARDIKNGNSQTENEIKLSLGYEELDWSITTAKILDKTDTTANIEKLDKITQYLRNEWKSKPNFNIALAIYYPVNRSVMDISLEISENYSFKQIDAYEQALEGVQIGFNSFFQWFRNLEDLENEARRDRPDYRNNQLEAVRQAIYSVIPGFSNLRVRRSPLRMTVAKKGEELIINQLSDGEKCLLAMVGDLARRLAIANPGLEKPLEGSGVVLIDEIELHLHPKWQREIIPALTRTFPNCQFIVTTHSPQVVSHVKPEGIYILEATPDGIVAKRPESSFGRDSNSILEDLMGVSERPQEIKVRLRELFRLIDAGNLNGARELRHRLADEIGYDEPEFVRADVLIRRKEILNR